MHPRIRAIMARRCSPGCQADQAVCKELIGSRRVGWGGLAHGGGREGHGRLARVAVQGCQRHQVRRVVQHDQPVHALRTAMVGL